MRLVTFTENNNTHIGLLTNDGIVDLSQAAASLPTDSIGFLEGGEECMAKAGAVSVTAHYSLDQVKLECPIPRPPMILAIGLNYKLLAE